MELLLSDLENSQGSSKMLWIEYCKDSENAMAMYLNNLVNEKEVQTNTWLKMQLTISGDSF